jgi:hypothetical protein
MSRVIKKIVLNELGFEDRGAGDEFTGSASYQLPRMKRSNRSTAGSTGAQAASRSV